MAQNYPRVTITINEDRLRQLKEFCRNTNKPLSRFLADSAFERYKELKLISEQMNAK